MRRIARVARLGIVRITCTIAEGADYEVRIRKSRPLLRLCFRCESETLQVVVLESDSNAAL
jgi:hypothetical protein